MNSSSLKVAGEIQGEKGSLRSAEDARTCVAQEATKTSGRRWGRRLKDASP